MSKLRQRSTVMRKLRRLGFAGSRAELLTGGRHRNSPGVAAVAAILGQRSGHDDLVTEFHRLALPAASLKSVWRTHLETPIRGGAILVLHIDVEPYVGIRPFHLRYKTLHCHWFVGIKFRRKGMVCDCGYSPQNHTRREGHKTNYALSHPNSLLFT